MRNLAIACIAVAGLMVAGSTDAEAGHRRHFGGHGHHSLYGGYGHGTYGVYHDTSHYDYHPPQWNRHGNHYHYQPGHYDFHQTGHFDTYHGGHLHW